MELIYKPNISRYSRPLLKESKEYLADVFDIQPIRKYLIGDKISIKTMAPRDNTYPKITNLYDKITFSRHDLIKTLLYIGIKNSYIINHILYLYECSFSNYHTKMFILEYYEDIMKELFNKYKVLDIEFYLHKIGFKIDIIERLLPVIKPHMNSKYSIEQVIKSGLKYLLGLYRPITNRKMSFLYKNDIVNKWFYFKGYNSIYNHPDGYMDICYYRTAHKYPKGCCKIFNYSKGCFLTHFNELEKIINLYVSNKNKTGDNDTLYYHVTNWRSYISLIRKISRGIDRRYLDFNMLPSFYLYLNLKDALEWGEKSNNRYYNELVIIIFKVPNSIFNKPNIKTKIFNGADQEWKNVTSSNRNYPDYELDKYDIIIGPMVANVDKVKLGDEPKPHHPMKIQLCCKSDIICEQLNQCFIGSIFFNKQSIS